jgi:hypothetical protein
MPNLRSSVRGERPSARRPPLSLATSVLLAASAVVALPRVAVAQPPDPSLLERLSHHGEALREITKRASLRSEALIEELGGDGKVSSTQTEVSHIETDGKSPPHEIVERAVKDGKDITAEEQEKKRKEEEEAKKKKDDESLTFPFISDAYDYDQVSVDAADPNRVEIAFSPKKPSKHTIEGKAWVDSVRGTLISAGVKLSKPPTFVDWVHFTAEFGAPTPLGPALSRIIFEVKGGLLFIRKHIRGEIKMSDYRIAP